MEIGTPQTMTDPELLTERVMVMREIARLTTYLGVIDAVRLERSPDDQEAEIIPLFS